MFDVFLEMREREGYKLVPVEKLEELKRDADRMISSAHLYQDECHIKSFGRSFFAQLQRHDRSCGMNNLIIFLMCFLTLWSIVLICGIFFGWRYMSKKRNESIKEFKKKHRIDL